MVRCNIIWWWLHGGKNEKHLNGVDVGKSSRRWWDGGNGIGRKCWPDGGEGGRREKKRKKG